MSYNDEPFTPSEVDEQLEQLQYTVHTSSQHNAYLVQHLHQLYSNVRHADTHSVENVWERLTQDGNNINMQPDNLPSPVPLHLQWEKKSNVTGKIFSSQRKFIESVAAVLIVAILVGSLAVVLNSIHQSQQGAFYTNSSPVAGIYTVSDTTVYKFDARTGVPVWQYNSKANWLNFFYSTPTIVGDSVYAPSNNGLFVLNASTGKLLWKLVWAGNSITDMNVFPLIRGNVVLISTVNGVSQGYTTPGSKPTVTVSTVSTLHALDTATGKELWSKPFPFGQAVTCTSCATGTNNILYIVSNNALYAINLADGSQRWRTSVTGDGQDIIASSNTVYLANDTSGVLQTFDTQSGKLLWNTSLEQGYQITHLQTSSSIVYLTASKGTNYYEAAYDAQTGAHLWKFPVVAMLKSGPLLSQNMLYISTQNGEVYDLDAQSGKKLWTYHADGDLYFSTVNNNTFYLEVGDAHTKENEHTMADGKQAFTLHSIVALSKDGTELQRYKINQNLTPQELVVGNGIIYLVAAPGPVTSFSFFPKDVVAFRTVDGKQLWQQQVPEHIIIGTIVIP